MKLTPLNPVSRTRRKITSFGGLNRIPNASGAYLGDMMNMTSSGMPSLSSRPARCRWHSGSSDEGGTADGNVILANDEITAAAAINGKIYFTTRNEITADGVKARGDKLSGSGGKRTIVPFGRNFFVVPDGVYAKQNEGTGYTCERCPKKFTSENAVSVKAVKEDGREASLPYSASFPEQPEAADSFIKTLGAQAYIYTYSDGEWKKGERIYPCFSAEGIGRKFTVGNKVVIKNAYTDDEKRTYTVTAVSDDEITVDAPYKGNTTKSGFSIERYFPLLDFAAESGNRVWGCRFGRNVFGEFVNEIYASALGDPMEWDCFEGISTDSYAASLGCSGVFTGAAVLGGRPVFFKENKIITVGGSSPQSFTVSAASAPGVEEGAENSLVNMNETLYYKSGEGITVYDGSSTRCISEKLGNRRFTVSAAGGMNGKYRAVFNFPDKTRAQYVYDSLNDAWHIEDDNENAKFFVPVCGSLISVCCTGDKTENGVNVRTYRFYADDADAAENGISIFSDTENSEFGFSAEGDSEFFAETREISASSGSEAVRSLIIRANKDENAVLKAGVVFGDNNIYREVCCIPGDMSGTFSLPVNTPRCSSFRLRFSGKGRVGILAVGIITEKTSEVNGYGI